MKPRTETEAVAAGDEAGGDGQKAGSFRTGTMGKRVEVGKGGQEIGKWRSFSHFETALTRLFPHVSTQVVDFPHLAMVRVFRRVRITAEAQRRRGKRSLEPRWGD